jgi:beta-mannosidase
MIATAPAAPADASIEIPLTEGWEVTVPGKTIPARVPGTVASALREHNLWRLGDHARFDSETFIFRCRFEARPPAPDEQLTLRVGGIATIAEVRLNGQLMVKSNSMFASHAIDVTALIQDQNELAITCQPLTTDLHEHRRVQPLGRWRTRIVSEQQLRWFRTTLLGRAPGFASEPEPVGPWRPITLIRKRNVAIDKWSRRVNLDGSTGTVNADLQFAISKPVSGRLIVGGHTADLEISDAGAHASLRIPNAEPWWPHTHGDPALYPTSIELELADGSIATFHDDPIGFRAWTPHQIPETFCRGVVWTPPDIVSLQASPELLRQRLSLFRDAGFNMIRLAGATIYESEAFHRLCDELGLMVWQDLMFANMDYPFADPDFRAVCRTEAESELTRISRHPSTAVICGNSEIEQQVGMLGLDPTLGRGDFFGQELPEIAARACPGVIYIPSAPCGGDLPFRTNTGVANYFGVGAYLRPVEDVRRAGVKFASECLAFANVPEPELIEKMSLGTRGGISPTHPAWKRAIPRDCGAGWDFEDVRDHYLQLLYSIDPVALRYADTPRYWDLSRIVTGELMAEVFGEWRRVGSPCAGGIVLWGADLEPGAGWGILDSDGHPKSVYWFLKRALAPHAIWMTDEGLNGLDIHVANDRPEQLDAILRIALYRHGEQKVAEGERSITIPARSTNTFGVEDLLGRFVDASYAYRFGPPGHDLVVASLHAQSGDIPFAQSFRFPAGPGTHRLPIAELGIVAESQSGGEVILTSKRFAHAVRISAVGYLPSDSYFNLEPNVPHRVNLTPTSDKRSKPAITAINAEGRITI